MSKARITYNASGDADSFIGVDAVNVYRAAMLASSLNMYLESGGRIIPTRGVGISRMLELASEILGQTYKRRDAAEAAKHLTQWVQDAKAAIAKATADDEAAQHAAEHRQTHAMRLAGLD